MSEFDRLNTVRAHAARVYANYASRLADALEKNPAAEPCPDMNWCREAWNGLVKADQAVRAYVMASDPIDDFYREQAALDDATEGTVQ